VRDPGIARAYATYFELLFQDPTTVALQQAVGALDSAA
jgi:hypothetical protein